MKPIICPECISLITVDEESETEEQVENEHTESNVKVFTDWRDYALHIIQEHPLSPRTSWVKACVENAKLKYQGKELPPKLKAIIEELSKINVEIEPEVETPKQLPPKKLSWFDKLIGKRQ